SGMGRKRHLPLGRPPVLIGITIHPMNGGEIASVQALDRSSSRRDVEISGRSYSHAADIGAHFRSGGDDGLRHIAGAKSLYATLSLAFGTWEPVGIGQTHLPALAAHRRDEQGSDRANI